LEASKGQGLDLEVGEIESLVDVTTTDNEVVVEMPGVSKYKIKINTYGNIVEVKSEDPQRKYHRTIEIPIETDIETGCCVRTFRALLLS
jgi:HSP20 family protein